MLLKFVAQQPGNPFPRYGLAMEYKKLGRLPEATAAFAALIEAHPDYIAAYLMAGEVLAESGDVEAAKAMYSRGITAAGAAGDDHALGELQTALGLLG
jgi:predicted Zn-dependent protease